MMLSHTLFVDGLAWRLALDGDAGTDSGRSGRVRKCRNEAMPGVCDGTGFRQVGEVP